MKFIHHSQEVNVADGVDIDVKVNIQFLPEVLFRFFSLKQLKIFKNNSTLKPVSVIPVSVSSLTSFFFRWGKSGRSITAAPDKIFTQTFFKGREEGWNCGLVGVSITSGNRKRLKNRK